MVEIATTGVMSAMSQPSAAEYHGLWRFVVGACASPV